MTADIARRYHELDGTGLVGFNAATRLQLARAEAWAEAEGLEVITIPETEPWDGDCPEPFEVVTVALVRPCDEHGQDCRHAEWLASLGMVGLTGHTREDHAYIRQVGAELACEVMPCQ